MPESEPIKIHLDGIDITKFHRLASGSPYSDPTHLVQTAVRLLLQEHAAVPRPVLHDGDRTAGWIFNTIRYC